MQKSLCAKKKKFFHSSPRPYQFLNAVGGGILLEAHWQVAGFFVFYEPSRFVSVFGGRTDGRHEGNEKEARGVNLIDGLLLSQISRIGERSPSTIMSG